MAGDRPMTPLNAGALAGHHAPRGEAGAGRFAHYAGVGGQLPVAIALTAKARLTAAAALAGPHLRPPTMGRPPLSR